MANTPVDRLDFDQIKASLKDYLRGQDTFKDYDFEGSTMNILLDVLAYNTHYQAFYANMVANEAFLDSARKRNSVVSLAKHLNYTPRSRKASRVTVNVKYPTAATTAEGNMNLNRASAGALVLPRGTRFTSRGQGGETYIFNTLEDYKFEVVSGELVVRNAVLYEGSLRTDSFVVNTKDSSQKFLLSDKNVDIDTIIVRVFASVSDTRGINDSWRRANDITELDGSSNSFFVQETEDGTWEVYFGDGVIGRAMENGNVIRVVYLSSNGENANGIGSTDTTQSPSFRSTGSIGYVVSVVTDTNGDPQPSFGGEAPESTDSIRFYAPRAYQAQERAVTADDYLAILARDYSLKSDSFLVWGGEENDPPQYGKVFISIKPKNSAKLSISEKQSITRNILGKRNVLTVTPEVVDPEVIYLNITTNVYYNPNSTILSNDEIGSAVRSRIVTFGDENLNMFGSNFRSSKFTTYIDATDPSINSSEVLMTLERRIEPQFNRTLPYTIKFDNALKHPVDGYPSILDSSSFYYLDYSSDAASKPTVVAYLDDDGYGNVRIYKLVDSSRVYLISNIGTIDYQTGKVVLKSFAPLGIPDGTVEIKLRVVPDRDDVFVRRNQVLQVNEDVIVVNPIEEVTVIDNRASDTKFPFRT
jgi:hypothetical protein